MSNRVYDHLIWRIDNEYINIASCTWDRRFKAMLCHRCPSDSIQRFFFDFDTFSLRFLYHFWQMQDLNSVWLMAWHLSWFIHLITEWMRDNDDKCGCNFLVNSVWFRHLLVTQQNSLAPRHQQMHSLCCCAYVDAKWSICIFPQYHLKLKLTLLFDGAHENWKQSEQKKKNECENILFM